jgi:hypothetical protein
LRNDAALGGPIVAGQTIVIATNMSAMMRNSAPYKASGDDFQAPDRTSDKKGPVNFTR